MRNKSAKLSSVLFAGVILLPLIGLLIMDYQTKKANDITGDFAVENVQGEAHGALASFAIIAGLAVFTITSFVIGKIRSRRVEPRPLEKINEEINRIDSHLKNL